MTSDVEGVRFNPATENVHGVDLWDCTVFTRSMVSTTADPGVASQFLRLRASLGREYQHQSPVSASVTHCRLVYPVARPLVEGPLFKASEMEDKWDVYFFDEHTYFVRSWTGQLIYRANVRVEDERMIVTQIECAEGRESETGRRTVDYLVKSHVLGAVTLHPLFGDVPADPMQIAVASFAAFGRRCACGTYADTTALPWTTAPGQPAPPSSSSPAP
jgi:hypothetical protein